MKIPESIQLRAESRDSREIGPIEPSCALATYNHQAALPQDRKVLGHCRPRDRECGGYLTGGALVAPDQRQDLPPRSIGDGSQHHVHEMGNVREFLRKSQLTYAEIY